MKGMSMPIEIIIAIIVAIIILVVLLYLIHLGLLPGLNSLSRQGKTAANSTNISNTVLP
ncbi:MAG: hypothetical protein QW061_00435 [Candidatus Rehaiarchaeum fermentans]|nr:hypothetical protein [Candidatus Rehaiarchaeum fermentans]MCW1292916.1 hypothetical protein [Candidatus Rehaiarchaeum fermentans]MCW1297131.1 hypothetical protein [Candidatus Rehaiarchaeum fermentans]